MKRLKLFLLIGCLAGGMTAPAWAQADDALPALVQVLAQTDDPQFQLDVLKGMAEGLKGKRGAKMPAGWEDLSAKLSRSANPEIRDLVQGLSLTFGSSSALAALRQGGRTRLYALNLASGQARVLGTVGDGRALWGMAIEP